MSPQPFNHTYMYKNNTLTDHDVMHIHTHKNTPTHIEPYIHVQSSIDRDFFPLCSTTLT